MATNPKGMGLKREEPLFVRLSKMEKKDVIRRAKREVRSQDQYTRDALDFYGKYLDATKYKVKATNPERMPQLQQP